MRQKAVLYLRLVDHSKVKEELAALKSLMICNEFEIIDQPIIEIGASYNTPIFTRGVIKNLLSLVKTEKVDAVICKNLNSLSRYAIEQIAIEEALLNENCRLIPADLDTPLIDEREELKSALENFYFHRRGENSCQKQLDMLENQLL